MPVELESKTLSCGLENSDAFRNYFFPNAISGNHCYVESFHERLLYPSSTDNNGASTSTSATDSSVLTKEIIFSALVLEQPPYSAHPRNFVAASSKLIGFAGLPLAKSARPLIAFPSFKWIFRIEVILSNPALSASG